MNTSFLRLVGALLLVLLASRPAEARPRGWKTYENKAYNIQFALPGNWSVETERSDEGVTWSGTGPDGDVGIVIAAFADDSKTPRRLFREMAKEMDYKIDRDTVEEKPDHVMGIGYDDDTMALIVAAAQDDLRYVLVFVCEKGGLEDHEDVFKGIMDSLSDVEARGGKDRRPQRQIQAADEDEDDDKEDGEAAAAPELEPGEWTLDAGIHGKLYPSMIVASSTLLVDPEDRSPNDLGDHMGFVGVTICAPEDNARVVVAVESGKLIKESRFEGRLPRKGEIYNVYPILKYDYDKMLSVRQPHPEVVTARVSFDGGKTFSEKSQRVVVCSINDCVFGFLDDDGDVVNTSFLFAAYVNENHPVIDQLLREALDTQGVDSFAGYQKDHAGVAAEIEAIWNVLKKRGFRYSNVTRASMESALFGAQHVRLLGDAIKSSQANCVEGSVLFASILRKLEMKPFLVSVPGHMFVGVHLDEEGDDFLFIETTMLATSSFEEATAAGLEQFKRHSDCFEDEDDMSCLIIDIADARAMGIMPLREPSAE